jgi:hypothetical protein
MRLPRLLTIAASIVSRPSSDSRHLNLIAPELPKT